MWDMLDWENWDKAASKLQFVLVHQSMWDWIYIKQLADFVLTGRPLCQETYVAPKPCAWTKEHKLLLSCQQTRKLLYSLCVYMAKSESSSWWTACVLEMRFWLVYLKYWLCFLSNRWTLLVSLFWHGTLWLYRTLWTPCLHFVEEMSFIFFW